MKMKKREKKKDRKIKKVENFNKNVTIQTKDTLKAS